MCCRFAYAIGHYFESLTDVDNKGSGGSVGYVNPVSSLIQYLKAFDVRR